MPEEIGIGVWIYDSDTFELSTGRTNNYTNSTFRTSSSNVTSIAVEEDESILYVGVNDGGVFKIDTSDDSVIKNWTSGNNEALVDYDVTSLAYSYSLHSVLNISSNWLLVGTLAGANSIARAFPLTSRTATPKRELLLSGKGSKGYSCGSATTPVVTFFSVTKTEGTGQRNASVI